MTTHDCLKALLKRLDIEHARQPQRAGKVIQRTSRLQLIQEPQPLLGEGEGQASLARDSN